MVRYLPLVLSFTQARLCDTPFCNVSRDNSAIPHKNKHEKHLRYYRYKYHTIWKVSLAVPLRAEWVLSHGGLRPLSAICAQSSTILHFCGPFGPLSKGNFRRKMTTIVGNRGQMRTRTLRTHLLSLHSDFPLQSRPMFKAPRYVISLRSKIAGEPRFSLRSRVKTGKTDSFCGNSLPHLSLQWKFGSEWRCSILLGRHACRTKLPPNSFTSDMKNGLNEKRSEKRSGMWPNNFKPVTKQF